LYTIVTKDPKLVLSMHSPRAPLNDGNTSLNFVRSWTNQSFLVLQNALISRQPRYRSDELTGKNPLAQCTLILSPAPSSATYKVPVTEDHKPGQHFGVIPPKA